MLALIAVYWGTLPTSSFKLNYDVLQCTVTNVALHTATVGECHSHGKKSRGELPEKVLITISCGRCNLLAIMPMHIANAETELRNLKIYSGERLW